MAEWIIEIKDGKFPIGKWSPLVRCKDCKHYHKAEPTKHGRWIELFETKNDITARCSECGTVYTLGKGRDPNYCGTCGATMDLDEAEE